MFEPKQGERKFYLKIDSPLLDDVLVAVLVAGWVTSGRARGAGGAFRVADGFTCDSACARLG